MGKILDNLTKEQLDWINSQKIFFVATAPLEKTGRVNLSPKGGDSFQLLSKKEFVYADYTGSAAETIAHIFENGRITIMFCAFEGEPRIFRFYGRGVVISESMKDFSGYKKLFPDRSGIRAIIKVEIDRISTSCGEQVPYYSYIGERDGLRIWENELGTEGLKDYRKRKNTISIDGLSIPTFE